MNILRFSRRVPFMPNGTLILTRLKSISALQAQFRDPSSPFYIPLGGKGPVSPDEIPDVHPTTTSTESSADSLEAAHRKLIDAGLDPTSFWEQKIAWGDQDSFRHVNNTRYVRFFESSRIKWMTSLGHEIGGSTRAQDMVAGRGASLILKSINVQFRRPVTYPDTLLIGYRPKLPSETVPKADPTTLYITASAYSVVQRAFVAHSDEAVVWYDYDQLKKCDPGVSVKEVILRRAQGFKGAD